MKLHLSIFAALLLAASAYAQQPRSRNCDFDGENASNICSLTTTPGIGTTFRLPDGVRIRDFVVTDPVNFHGESNGVIGIVTPRAAGKSTSINIYADNDKLYVFYLASVAEPHYVDQLAVVKSTEYQLFQQRVRSEAQAIAQDQRAELAARYEADLEKESAQIRKHLLFSINSDYRITGNVFAIDAVSDDGVFTYVKLARSQERPVVYIGEAGKPKNLETVKYTDEGDHYVIHRVLTHADKGFVLKLGDKTSEIKRR
jgi:type IV secretory pathway VirB9-like protein